MQLLQSAFIPALLAWTGLYALYKGVDVFPTFLHGAKKGLQTAVGILPTMVGMLTVVYMLRASGAIDLAAALLAPVFQFSAFPRNARRWPCSNRSPAAGDWRSAAKSCSAAARTAMPDG